MEETNFAFDIFAFVSHDAAQVSGVVLDHITLRTFLPGSVCVGKSSVAVVLEWHMEKEIIG